MSPFWGNLYDTFKDRRYAALFLVALFGLALSPVLVPVLAIYGLSRAAGAWARSRENRRNRWRRAPLSRDELRVARSKLRSGSPLVLRPVERVPDVNLKY